MKQNLFSTNGTKGLDCLMIWHEESGYLSFLNCKKVPLPYQKQTKSKMQKAFGSLKQECRSQLKEKRLVLGNYLNIEQKTFCTCK